MSSDPFCRIRMGDLRSRTKTVSRDLNPVWNELFAIGFGGDKDWMLRDLEITVWDEDIKGLKADFLGQVINEDFIQKCSLFVSQRIIIVNIYRFACKRLNRTVFFIGDSRVCVYL